jgi:hypothetical protein
LVRTPHAEASSTSAMTGAAHPSFFMIMGMPSLSVVVSVPMDTSASKCKVRSRKKSPGTPGSYGFCPGLRARRNEGLQSPAELVAGGFRQVELHVSTTNQKQRHKDAC